MTTDIEAARKAAEIAKAELRGEITPTEAEVQRAEYGIMQVKKEVVTPTPVLEPTIAPSLTAEPTKVDVSPFAKPIYHEGKLIGYEDPVKQMTILIERDWSKVPTYTPPKPTEPIGAYGAWEKVTTPTEAVHVATLFAEKKPTIIPATGALYKTITPTGETKYMMLPHPYESMEDYAKTIRKEKGFEKAMEDPLLAFVTGVGAVASRPLEAAQTLGMGLGFIAGGKPEIAKRESYKFLREYYTTPPKEAAIRGALGWGLITSVSLVPTAKIPKTLAGLPSKISIPVSVGLTGVGTGIAVLGAREVIGGYAKITKGIEPEKVGREIKRMTGGILGVSAGVGISTMGLRGLVTKPIMKYWKEREFVKIAERQFPTGLEYLTKKEKVLIGKGFKEYPSYWLGYEKPKLYKEAYFFFEKEPWLLTKAAKVKPISAQAVYRGAPGWEVGWTEAKFRTMIPTRYPVFDCNPLISSSIALFMSPVFTTLEATRTPLAPNWIAFSTSSLVLIPAPHRTIVFGEILLTLSTDRFIISGLAFDTDIFPPINSGGSIAIKSGFNFAIEITSCMSLAHTNETRLYFPHSSMFFSMSLKGILLSE